MKIRIHGFEITLHPCVPVNELISELRQAAGKRIQYQKHDRILNLTQKTGWLLGSIWTDKGETKFSEIDQRSNIMQMRGLDPGKALSSFNFFIISLKTLRGLVTQYSESGGVSLVGGLLARSANTVIQVARERAVAALHRDASAEEKKSARGKCSGEALKCDPLLNRQQWAIILESFRRIRSVGMRFKTAVDDPPKVGSVIVATEEKKLTFVRDTGLMAAISFITDLISNGEAKDADAVFVEATNGDGIELRIPLESIPDWFGVVDFDDVANDPTLFDTNLANAVLIKKLQEAARRRPLLF